MVDYYHATRGGRVAFGKGGWGIALGASAPLSIAMPARAHRRGVAAAGIPGADVPVTHDWSGPIDRTPDSLPLGRLGGLEHVVYGVGWSGNGVGPTCSAGRTLTASLALGRDDEWANYPLVDRSAARFPPKSGHSGAHVVRSAVARKERAEIRGELLVACVAAGAVRPGRESRTRGGGERSREPPGQCTRRPTTCATATTASSRPMGNGRTRRCAGSTSSARRSCGRSSWRTLPSG